MRQARAATGLSQAELARRIGSTQSAVARLERAGSNPRVETLQRAIAATGHDLEVTLTQESGIDETLIAASLTLSPAQRLDHFAAFYRSAQALAGAKPAPSRGS